MTQEETNISTLEKDLGAFRENLGTAEASGKRKWVFAKKTKGKYTTWRDIVSAILLILLFVVPFIRVHGNPLFMFDILSREFYIFGAYFSPTDSYLFAIGLVTTIVFVIVFTVIYGRIFCGWICPQTIFMENVFRKIEYWIEGDRNKQIRLSKQEWDSEKIRKRLLKFVIFALLSFIISNLLFSYVIGTEALGKLITEGPLEHFSGFIGIFVFSAAFYFIFGWFREQVCSFICPYGRLQGVLIDKDTVNIVYDFVRGEGMLGRAKWRKNEDRKSLGKGDCIDCDQCVVVCPAGIDIRNGNQLECVNCTACIDACDEVMVKIGFPTGLICYASENMIERRTKFRFTPRIIAYTAVLCVLIGVCMSLLFIRSSVESKFLKLPGTQYEMEGADTVVDEYQFTFINKTTDTKKLTVKIISPEKANLKMLNYSDNSLVIKPRGFIKGVAEIRMPKAELKREKEEIVIGTFDEQGNQVDTYTTTFIGPFKITF
ncbi:MAG: cytochrome c oxidase accessory protein CcoG [Flavobacteriaceae bacterium]|jgi:cytochrome c oxidase accessory protein FixG|nr:cytochrome c oxidase accessory protein CcoG [Flavobacteriaceae bacterium]